MKATRLRTLVERIVVEALEGEPDQRDQLLSVYSDVYKEKYGIRPRWKMAQLAGMTVDQINAELDALVAEPDDEFDIDDVPPPDYPGADVALGSEPLKEPEEHDPHEKLAMRSGMGKRLR